MHSKAIYLGGSQEVWLPIYVPITSKYPLDICQIKELPILKCAKIYTIFPNSIDRIGRLKISKSPWSQNIFWFGDFDA